MSSLPVDQEFIPLEEAARLLKCAEITLKARLSSGELVGLLTGRDWTIPRAAFIESVNALALKQAQDRRKRFAPPKFDQVEMAAKRRRGQLPEFE